MHKTVFKKYLETFNANFYNLIPCVLFINLILFEIKFWRFVNVNDKVIEQKENSE